MERGQRRLQWIALVLAMIFSLTLMSLDAFVLQPVAVVASRGTVRIMPLGDSITYGQGSINGGGYRLPLWNALRMRGARITFVGSIQNGPAQFSNANQGMPGWTIDQVAEHVVDWLIVYQPQIILLHIGTNDFVKHDDPMHAPARLKNLINEITVTLPDAILIIAQIIPLARSPQLGAEVVSYNAILPGIVRSEVALGRHVQLVDMYHVVSPSSLTDGIHPDDRAYALMAQVWERALLPLLRPKDNQDFSVLM